MKIEKLTENKIRIILKQEDFKDKNIDIRQLLLTTPYSQSLFLEILDRAKKEIDFDTDGQKLFIEISFQIEDVFIFTITKYTDHNKVINHSSKKYLTIKKKNEFSNSLNYIYKFNTFENFCDFCNFINKNITIKNLFKTCILYLYNNTYYLVIDEINKSSDQLPLFHSLLLEFSDSFIVNKNLKLKLAEYGKIIMKNNAIKTGIKYFSD